MGAGEEQPMRYLFPIISTVVLVLWTSGCDRRTEVPRASSPEACTAVDLGQAADLASRGDLPVDRVITVEGMPHHTYFGWTQEGRKRAVSKLLGTERKLLLLQEFEGESPPTGDKMTGLLRRYRDLPANPWDAVKQGIKTQFAWDVPEDAYVIMEGVEPEGC